MQLLDWEDYLRPADLAVAAHKAKSAATFAAQKENIRKLSRILKPRSVVCMGAGYLNDIPLDELIAADADIYFAEWIDGITERSFRHDLVRRIAGQLICFACKCSGDPRKYCKNYRGHGSGVALARADEAGNYCSNFLRADEGAVPLCRNFTAGDFPRYLRADVTRGIAEHFARQVPAMIRRARKPQQAFRYAIHASVHPRGDAPLPLADRSADFITSSLVASQFDFEPYNYFLRNLYLYFGREAVERNRKVLERMVETLRDDLFLTQVSGHCEEMLRLLKPDGRIYFSIESLHADHPGGPYFQSEMFCKAMEAVGRHFHFDLQTLPEMVAPARTPMVEGGESVIQSYLLVPKHPQPS